MFTRDSPDCYYQIAQNLAEGTGFSLRHHHDECDQANKLSSEQPTADRMPGYPLLLAGLIKLTNDNPAAPRLLQVALGTGTIVVLYWLGARFVSPIAGLTAAIFISVGGGLPTFSYLLLSELFYLALTLICFALLIYKRTPRSGLLIGALLGAALLTRPGIMFTVPFILIWMWRYFPNPIKSISLTIVSIALVMAPWIIRNALVFGAFIPTSTNGGELAWVTYNPTTFSTRPGANVPSFLLPHWEEVRSMPERQRDQFLWKLALEEISRQPFDKFLWLFRARMVNYFIFSNSISINQVASSALSLSYVFTLFGLVCLYLARHPALSPVRHWLALPGNLAIAQLLLIMVFSQFVTPVLFFGDGRYRFTVEPFMALTLGSLWTLLWPRSISTPG